MDVSHIINPLNDVQREAVQAPPASLLVLAGAGSGKTRVLTHRIAWLIQEAEVSPWAILAMTFTNKAAREMRGRVDSILNTPSSGLWMGTFHGLCHRLLRMHYSDAGLIQEFEIIDSADQLRLVKRVLRELDLDEKHWPPKPTQWMINSHKEEARRPHHLHIGDDKNLETLHQIYVTYEELCQRFALVDFAEILLRTFELFSNNQTVREHYQNRFQHVLIDEFQDTNSIQYQWIRILAAKHQSLFVVGDDDQSIYGWRGAKVENILSFEKYFTNPKVFRLEQNYRSTGNILNAANEVISNNSGRLGKKLWTNGPKGSKITQYTAFNQNDEANYVIDRIRSWVAQGNRRDQSAILYRSNAQSRIFEEKLVRHAIPYRVYGGLRFFERAEIKDALAYMKLISNRNSDPSFERIVNLPTRGIGNRTLDIIKQRAKADHLSMWQGSSKIIAEQGLPARALSALVNFQNLINQIAANVKKLGLSELTDQLLKQSGLLEHFGREQEEVGQAKVENLQELVNATRNFASDPEEEMDDLSFFLSHAALEAGERQSGEWEDCVQLMTLHSAKGLEFPLVFLCGLEEGLFPNQRSIDKPDRLEEERRLCYVGMTRAMKQLHVSHAKVRFLYGREHFTQPSRFLSEIPAMYKYQAR